MKLLLVTPGFLPAIGGAEIGLHEIARRLGRRHTVAVLAPSVKGNLPEGEFTPDGYRVIRYRDFLNLGRAGGRMLLRGSLPPFSLGALVATARAIQAFRPELVNVHYAAYTGLAAVWAQHAARLPTVLSLVGRDATPGPQVPRLWPWYAARVAGKVAHAVFLSEYSRSFYKDAGVQASVIPYGADTRRIVPRPPDPALQAALELSPGARVLFTLGRLAPLKHVEVAIQSLRCLREQRVEDVVLLIGGSGPEEGRLRRLADQLGLSRQIRFLGYLPEEKIPDYFSLADIFVFPSVFETFGIVLAQAMAAGLPVAAAHSSAVPEVVLHGETGLLSEPLDAGALAGNLRLLLGSEDLRKRMGQTARARAEAYFDWEQVADRYEALFLQVARVHTTSHEAGDSL